MKICLWYEDTVYSDFAYLYPERGNDGMAGTQYEYAMLGKFYSISYPEDIVYMCHTEKNKMYSGIRDYIYRDTDDALDFFKREQIDVVIFTVGQTNEWYEKLNKYDYDIPFIAWDHNHIPYEELKNLRNASKVKRVVCCGKELYDMYIDDEIITKMTFIFNMLDSEMYSQREDIVDCNVTFLGAITPQKGFHILAKVWKSILSEVPEAQLYVAGSGKLYNKTSILGNYGIAEQSYEDVFMSYLIDEEGKILDSVHFLGIIDFEGKRELLAKTKVGIVNPSAKTECCSISTLEFSSAGVPIATRREYGFFDTVENGKTGLLSRTERQFRKDIIRLLKDDALNVQLSKNGKAFVRKRFAPQKLIAEWHQVIEDSKSGKEVEIVVPQKNYSNRGKWLRVFNYRLKSICILKSLPSMIDYNNIAKKILK